MTAPQSTTTSEPLTTQDSPDAGNPSQQGRRPVPPELDNTLLLLAGQHPDSLSVTEEPPYLFNVFQQWEGIVLEVEQDRFFARLRDLFDPTRPEMTATFDVAEISAWDQSRLAPGSIFYWSIGYRKDLNGSVKNESSLHLKRERRWTKRDLSAIKRTSSAFDSLFSTGS